MNCVRTRCTNSPTRAFPAIAAAAGQEPRPVTASLSAKLPSIHHPAPSAAAWAYASAVARMPGRQLSAVAAMLPCWPSSPRRAARCPIQHPRCRRSATTQARSCARLLLRGIRVSRRPCLISYGSDWNRRREAGSQTGANTTRPRLDASTMPPRRQPSEGRKPPRGKVVRSTAPNERNRPDPDRTGGQEGDLRRKASEQGRCLSHAVARRLSAAFARRSAASSATARRAAASSRSALRAALASSRCFSRSAFRRWYSCPSK
jgi:hypothetical protein